MMLKAQTVASQALLGRKAARPAARTVCRAEPGEGLAKVDRSKDQLFFPSEASLTYLDGSLPGDFGFDPLGLLDPVNSGGFITPEWLAYGEVMNARWAMLGAAGIIAPEILGAAGLIPEATRVDWWRTGVIPPAGTYEGYWTDPYTLFAIEVVLMQFAELKRLQDFRYPGSQAKQYFLGIERVFEGSGNPAYPGGPWFNMFNLGKTEAAMNELKLKEIKNGRLAMLAVLGYGAQAVLTQKGPFQNLQDHLADPLGNNILSNFGKILNA